MSLKSCANPSCSAEESKEADLFKRCSRCKLVSYCTSECQKKHWAAHKSSCKAPKSESKGEEKSSDKKAVVVSETFSSESKCDETGEIDLDVQFRCKPKNLYDAFTDVRDITNYTMSKTEMDAKVGGYFTMFDGNITGQFVEMKEYSKLVFKWKSKAWGKGVFSVVELSFNELEDGLTELKLHHTGIPLHDGSHNPGVVEATSKGWKQHFFENIFKVLGYAYDKE